MSKSTTRKAAESDAPAVSPSDLEPTVDAPSATPTTTDAGGTTYAVVYDDADGEVTFSRGDESYTFNVEGGRITTTKERADWLLRYTAARPVAEKE